MGQPEQHGDIVIRPRTAHDVAAAGEVLREVFAIDGYPVEGVADPIAWLTPPRLVRAWVATEAASIVGHVSVSEISGDSVPLFPESTERASGEQSAVLERLFVSPAARGKQVGAQLVVAATEYAVETGVRLFLEVLAKDKAAIRLYERLGWTFIGAASHAYGNAERAESRWYRAP
ncbi:GNAT family N-acetyltransferase [Streptomyces sp. ERV7]|uniref:GNAT family N-acetyltransferase n=1 Tax=Streptomyces sp. ERV7 TaxID=1322334 RepID=UPI00099FA75C|nr:GNAT family N-acetyltransferase [Streptomyces sp. ERV7]